ncbi:MAG: thioredoxin 1 [Saprospiraceae bacterium]|jgi:thioredoxin 1
MNIMKNISKYLLFLFCFAFVNQMQAAKVEFSSTNFEEVKQQAQANNRPYFTYFTATWCMPCRMMDETTWQDPNLAKYIDENYYAVKIDVDNFDGYVYREEFKVVAYPTILLFQPDGTFMKRIEGSITGSKLQTYLEQYDGFEDTYGGNYDNDPNDIENIPPPPIIYTPLPDTGMPTETNAPMNPPTPTYDSSHSVPDYTPGYQPKSEKIVSSGSGLFRFNVVREPSEGFSVQVGVYADYENVMREVSAYQLQFDEPILVHIDKLQDKTVYKVLIGDFKKRDKAAKYKEKVLESGIPEAFVKDLTTMK